jgi:hypothetical protein
MPNVRPLNRKKYNISKRAFQTAYNYCLQYTEWKEELAVKRDTKKDDADIGNYVYGKIEAKSRKTDPFMALVASMTIEDMIPYAQTAAVPDIGVMTY